MRSRNIKPGFFKNEILGVQDPLIQIAFIGLWCMADRDGILEDRPLRLKAEIFPYRENIDFNGYLTVMSRLDFIQRYVVEGKGYILIKNFSKHQNPHHTEKSSGFPKPLTNSTGCDLTVTSPLNHGDNPADLLIPDSMIHDSLIHEKDLLSDSPESDQKEKIDDEIIYFVTGFQNAVLEAHGAKAPKITDSLIKNGSSCIDKLIRLDGFEKEEVFNAIRWAYKDSFWSNQVFSMASLRTKGKNGLMKFQNIINSMQIKPQSITGSLRTDQNIRAAMEFINDGR